MNTVTITTNLEITNGNIFDCIGRDKNFSPVVYFKLGYEKEKVIQALTCYFDNHTINLSAISPFLSEMSYTDASQKIQHVCEEKANDFYNRFLTAATPLNGYIFSYLPTIK